MNYFTKDMKSSKSNINLLMKEFHNKMSNCSVIFLIMCKIVRWENIKREIFKSFKNKCLLNYYKL